MPALFVVFISSCSKTSYISAPHKDDSFIAYLTFLSKKQGPFSRQEGNLNRIDLLFLSEHEKLRLFLGKIWEVYVAKGDAKGATPNLERVKEEVNNGHCRRKLEVKGPIKWIGELPPPPLAKQKKKKGKLTSSRSML